MALCSFLFDVCAFQPLFFSSDLSGFSGDQLKRLADSKQAELSELRGSLSEKQVTLSSIEKAVEEMKEAYASKEQKIQQEVSLCMDF